MSTPTTERVVHPELAGRVASLLPLRDGMTPHDLVKLADSLIGVGMRIAGILHDEDPEDAWSLVDGLTEERRWALPFVIAAMVDIEKSARQLLSWAPFAVPVRYEGATSVAPPALLLRERPRRNELRECGTQAAWDRHNAHDEEPCDACWIAHRAWEADKKQAQRDAKRGRPPANAAQRARERAETRDIQVQLDLLSLDTDEETTNAA